MFERLSEWWQELTRADASSLQLDEMKLKAIRTQYGGYLQILKKNPNAYKRKKVLSWEQQLEVMIAYMERMKRPREWVVELKKLKGRFDDFLRRTE